MFTLTAPYQRPFLKWAGGKFQILDRIFDALPAGTTLIEAFAGSGAVFLNANHDRFVVNDINHDLIGLYESLREGGEDFVRYVATFFAPENNREEMYYELRNRFNKSKEVVERSALLVYLNRHGYNGLVRYNAKHEFNVPFGRYTKPYFPRAEMQAFFKRAQTAEFSSLDFAEVMDNASPGSVVYADPPYVPLSQTSNFTSYSSQDFGPDDQRRLAEVAERTAARGVPVLISNHDTPETRALYQRAKLVFFDVQRSISCKGDARNKVGELLALFDAPPP